MSFTPKKITIIWSPDGDDTGPLFERLFDVLGLADELWIKDSEEDSAQRHSHQQESVPVKVG